MADPEVAVPTNEAEVGEANSSTSNNEVPSAPNDADAEIDGEDGANAAPSEEVENVRVAAIEIGSDSARVAVGSTLKPHWAQLLTDTQSNYKTPAVVAFNGSERAVGEMATRTARTHVSMLADLVAVPEADCAGLGLDGVRRHCGFTLASSDASPFPAIEVPGFLEGRPVLESEHVLGMLLRPLYERTKHRQNASEGDIVWAHDEPAQCAIVVSSVPGPQQVRALIDAATIARLPVDHLSFVTVDQALATKYHITHPLPFPNADEAPAAGEGEGEAEGLATKTVVFVDVGHAETNMSAAEYRVEPVYADPPAATEGGEEGEEGEEGEAAAAEEEEPAAEPEVVGYKHVVEHLGATTVRLGALNLADAIFDIFAAQITEKVPGCTIKPGSRLGRRVMHECLKALKTLSTVGEAATVVENVEEQDVPVRVSREAMEAAVADKLALIAGARAAVGCGDREFDEIVVVGGGTRIPAVKAALCAEFGVDEDGFAYTLDVSNAVVEGAVGVLVNTSAEFVGFATNLEAADAPGLGADTLANLTEVEDGLAAADEERRLVDEARYKLEAYIYSMREEAQYGKHKDLIDSEAVLPLLDQASIWLDDAWEASSAEIYAKVTELEAAVEASAPDYASTLARERAEEEASLAAAAAAAAAEREANGEDDHDTRKLSKPKRMRLVMLNKEEGNELFRDGNYSHAAGRYVKALTHAAKFFDLSPEDETEIGAVKLSLHLNLAMCYLKMESWQKAVENCNYALEIDPDSVKGLFRRATGLTKVKDWDAAKADINRALELSPDDAKVKRLGAQIEAAVKKQKDKEKKMYGKMFG